MVKKRQRKKNLKKNSGYQFPVGDKTLDEYRRQVRNTKAKINRTKRNHGVDLSGEVNIPKLEDISSRKEFNSWVKEQERFRNRNVRDYQIIENQYGVKTYGARDRRIKERVKKAQELADKQIAKYEDKPFVSGGKEQGTVGMQRPNKSGIYRPSDYDFDDVRSQQRLDEIEESAINRSDEKHYDERNERMKENFITALSGSFNSLADELIEEIKQIPAEDFVQIYFMFDEFDFDYFDTEGQAVTSDETSVGQMMKYVNQYKEGGLDTDLWHENFK